MSNQLNAKTTRYETIIVTVIGFSAVFVSAYTAYIQRQQVRAAVWPILEYNTSNEPAIKFTLDNKGVGPAIIQHVQVTVDGQPVLNWHDALERLFGPGHHKFSESTMSGHVLSPNESMNIMVPLGDDGVPLDFAKGGPLWEKANKDRARLGIEICYSSTLGECWTLHSDGTSNTNTQTSRCPEKSATTFQQ